MSERREAASIERPRFWERRSRFVRFGAHRYGQCRAVRTAEPRFGWFATGNGVPEAGPVHWGFLGQTRAFIDAVRLAWRHRENGSTPPGDQP